MPRGSGLSALNEEKQVQYRKRVRAELEGTAAGDPEAKEKLQRTRREVKRKAAVRPSMRVGLLAATRQWRRRDVARFVTPSVRGQVGADALADLTALAKSAKWQRGTTLSGHASPQMRVNVRRVPASVAAALETVAGGKITLVTSDMIKVDASCCTERKMWRHNDAAEVDDTGRVPPGACSPPAPRRRHLRIQWHPMASISPFSAGTVADSPGRHLTIIVLVARERLRGGQIAFPHAGRTFNYAAIEPGGVLAWANVDEDLHALDSGVHEVHPVERGYKILYQAMARVGG